MIVNMFKCNLCKIISEKPMVSIVIDKTKKNFVMSSHDDGSFHLCSSCTKALKNTFNSSDKYYPA